MDGSDRDDCLIALSGPGPSIGRQLVPAGGKGFPLFPCQDMWRSAVLFLKVGSLTVRSGMPDFLGAAYGLIGHTGFLHGLRIEDVPEIHDDFPGHDLFDGSRGHGPEYIPLCQHDQGICTCRGVERISAVNGFGRQHWSCGLMTDGIKNPKGGAGF